MPTIAQAVEAAKNIDQSRFQYVEQPSQHPVPAPEPVSLQRDPFILSPLPPTTAQPDNLRQWYRPGIPQTRCSPAAPPAQGIPFSEDQIGSLQDLADQNTPLQALAAQNTPLQELAANAAALLALL